MAKILVLERFNNRLYANTANLIKADNYRYYPCYNRRRSSGLLRALDKRRLRKAGLNIAGIGIWYLTSYLFNYMYLIWPDDNYLTSNLKGEIVTK